MFIEIVIFFFIRNMLKTKEVCSILTTAVASASGHLELEADVKFVDISGRSDRKGNLCIDKELTNADVMLFFEEGRSGRPVSSEDISHIFRRLDEVQLTSRS